MTHLLAELAVVGVIVLLLVCALLSQPIWRPRLSPKQPRRMNSESVLYARKCWWCGALVGALSGAVRSFWGFGCGGLNAEGGSVGDQDGKQHRRPRVGAPARAGEPIFHNLDRARWTMYSRLAAVLIEPAMPDDAEIVYREKDSVSDKVERHRAYMLALERKEKEEREQRAKRWLPLNA